MLFKYSGKYVNIYSNMKITFLYLHKLSIIDPVHFFITCANSLSTDKIIPITA